MAATSHQSIIFPKLQEKPSVAHRWLSRPPRSTVPPVPLRGGTGLSAPARGLERDLRRYFDCLRHRWFLRLRAALFGVWDTPLNPGPPLCGLSAGEPTRSLFAPEIIAALAKGESELIAFGLAGGPVDHAALSVSGPPPQATNASPALVGWGWFINLQKGDRIVVHLSGPGGQQIAFNRSEPLDRAKASYSAFAGKKGTPKPGVYEVKVAVERGGSVLFERSGTYSIE